MYILYNDVPFTACLTRHESIVFRKLYHHILKSKYAKYYRVYESKKEADSCARYLKRKIEKTGTRYITYLNRLKVRYPMQYKGHILGRFIINFIINSFRKAELKNLELVFE